MPYVSSLLTHDSVKIQAKALWLLGEMGLSYPQSVQDAVPAIASFLDSPEPLLRERAVNALGRIGRGSYPAIEPHWAGLFRFASDEASKVRLAFIWASENIATNAPDILKATCRYLRSSCMMRMTRCGWKRRRSSASSASAGRNSSSRI
ncbi:MAG: HEAT repeat domain-containing protein [Lachnospiraceae bacterium]|nr:HEAT repeat domain-containing protein [Lachnospiraceae bacterium]